MIRENLETNPITSYLYFGKYKFRVQYAGQQTTCGYYAEKVHLERNFQIKGNYDHFNKKFENGATTGQKLT